jgi:hypothetical protein
MCQPKRSSCGLVEFAKVMTYCPFSCHPSRVRLRSLLCLHIISWSLPWSLLPPSYMRLVCDSWFLNSFMLCPLYMSMSFLMGFGSLNPTTVLKKFCFSKVFFFFFVLVSLSVCILHPYRANHWLNLQREYPDWVS